MYPQLLQEVQQNCISITADSATLNGRSYTAVTAHYITSNWEMRDVVLSIALSATSHTGDYVSDLFDKVMKTWRVKGKTFAVVTDNGSNFVKGARINDNISDKLRCAVHTLQLTLKDAASQEAVSDSLKTYRYTCIYTYAQYIYIYMHIDRYTIYIYAHK